MPGLPVISARECIRALERAGYYISRQRGSHITLRRDDPPGRVTIPNHKELKSGTLRSILRQASLSVDEFLELL